MHEARFADRLKAGELDKLTKGAAAKKLKLADQYRMYQQGDVARRLELEKRGHPAAFYHGVVSPAYQRACLKYHYWGPRFFAGVCWYPLWSPWVEWSWHYHCNPYWDPRPIWCRPVVYVACPAWGYWETPVWTPLPVVSCGTWVDLRPVVLPAAQTDLQLVAVRFVDPGHPEQRTGPRYRVWFRNNGSQPIVRPFNVMLFASNDARLTPGLPQAGVRVTAIEAGDTQSVDIRLPVEVYTMGRDAQGNPAPFAVLHALVDAGRETPDVIRANNGARLAPGRDSAGRSGGLRVGSRRRPAGRRSDVGRRRFWAAAGPGPVAGRRAGDGRRNPRLVRLGRAAGAAEARADRADAGRRDRCPRRRRGGQPAENRHCALIS